MNTLTIIFAAGWAITFLLLVRSLFRQAGIQDAMKETSQASEDQLKLWEEFGQHLDEAVALVNDRDEIQYANEAFAELTGWQRRSAFHQQLGNVVHLEDAESKTYPVPAEETAEPLFVISQDGARTPVYAAKRKLHKPEGYSVAVLRDATAETAEKEIRHRLINLSSFELRAPVTAMKGYASMLLDGDAGKLSKDVTEYVKPILESTDTLLGIIDDMAHVEELSTTKSSAKKKEVDVAQFLVENSDRLLQVAKEASRDLDIAHGKLKASMAVDEQQISRLLLMLVNTASRTAADDSAVKLHLETKDRTIEFVIENEGSPLPKQSQANVFDYVGGRGLDEGIGFYVAKQIIESHGAYVSVNTQPHGNKFILSLPRVVDEPPTVPHADQVNPDSDEIDTSPLEHVAEAAQEQAEATKTESDSDSGEPKL